MRVFFGYKHIDPLRGLRPVVDFILFFSFLFMLQTYWPAEGIETYLEESGILKEEVVTNILTRWGDWDRITSVTFISFYMEKLQTYWPAEGIETNSIFSINCFQIYMLQTYWPAEGIETQGKEEFAPLPVTNILTRWGDWDSF